MPWFTKHKLLDWLVLLGLAMVFVATTWALFKPGFFWIHDPLHAARMGEMLIGLKDGHLPVRWSQNFGYGFGIPLFEFYAPLPYLFGAVVLGLGLPLEWSFKLLFLVPSLIAILGAYGLGKSIMGRAGGVLLATLFALAPYRAVNLFVRGAVSESWAMMTFPWIIWGGLKLLRGEAHGRWILLVSVVALLLSHNITSLLFLPVATVFTLAWWLLETGFNWKRWQRYWKPVLEFVATQVLAVGVASFYVAPALLEKVYVAIEVTTTQYYHFANHFLYLRQLMTPFWGYGNSVYGPNDGLSFFLGWGMLLGLVGCGVMVVIQIISWFKIHKLSSTFKLGLLSLTTLSFSMLMATEKTSFIWERVAWLSFTQFPWRFLSLATLFGSLAIVLMLASVPYKKLQLGLLLTLIGLTLNTAIGYFQPREFLPQDQTTYFTQPEQIRAQLGSTLLEYLPQGLPADVPPSYQLLDLPTTQYQVISDKVQTRQVQVQLDQVQSVTWQVAAYPGWETTIDDQKVPHNETAKGLMSVTVPAGSHTLGLSWGYTTIRLVSDTISLVSLGVVLFWLLARKPTR